MRSITLLLVLVFVLSLPAAGPLHGQIWDNGGPTVETQMLKLGGWIEADNFTVTGPTQISGFTMWGSSLWHPSSEYLGLYWWIYSDASGLPGATVFASGNAANRTFFETITFFDNDWDVYQHDVSTGSFYLDPGDYWLALHNGPLSNTTDEYDWAMSSLAGDGGAVDASPFGDGWSDRFVGELAFQIHGTVVPEPSTIMLLATGLFGVGGVGLVRRRKRNDEV